ncbi:unnamed protein product [Arctia plantaginis]|uniref:Uncharacterized protein n=1 Tax=Arctia plantaginis TaxID=874455 RepID=A0A8S1B4M1_ARCPL|nr:unnamed protein product [Arctia plantaginis]
MLVECKSSAEEGCTNDSENTDSETSDSERLDTQKENLDSTYVEGTTLGSTTSDEDFSNATSDPDITLEVPGTSDTQSKRVRRKPDRFGYNNICITQCVDDKEITLEEALNGPEIEYPLFVSRGQAALSRLVLRVYVLSSHRESVRLKSCDIA